MAHRRGAQLRVRCRGPRAVSLSRSTARQISLLAPRSQSGDANADRLAAEPGRGNGRWVQTRGSWSRRPTFAVHGKQRVKIGWKYRILPALSGLALLTGL